MAITTESLTAPAGRLASSLFPTDDEEQFEARLEAYVADAEAKTAVITDAVKQEEAQLAWAYYRAYDAIYERMTTSPIEVDLDVGGRGTFSTKQIENVERIRNGYLNQFNTIIAELSALASTTVSAGTVAVESVVRFW
jgi:hypothetical protein